MRTLCIGDIHGAYRALIQVLERSGFDYQNDMLIIIGDIADGWSEVYQCVEELLKIKNKIFILGNHDHWFIDWLNKGLHPVHWLQGGHSTALSYAKHAEREDIQVAKHNGAYITNLTTFDIPVEHVKFWNSYHIKYHDTNRNYFFVHGGFDRHTPVSKQDIFNFTWDRELFNQALSFKASGVGKFHMEDDFKKVFIGHTATVNWKDKNGPITYPIIARPVYNLDTGGGWYGKLTIMDVDTEEYWQSDMVNELYKEERGRL